MDSMILLIAGVAIVILLVVVIMVASKGGQKGRKKVKGRGSSHKLSSEINPDAIVNRIFKLAPSELKTAKEEYIGKTVEIRTVFKSISSSKKGGTYRQVNLDFQDNRNIHITGELNTADYKDPSWMTKEGKLRISGIIKEMRPKEFILDNVKII